MKCFIYLRQESPTFHSKENEVLEGYRYLSNQIQVPTDKDCASSDNGPLGSWSKGSSSFRLLALSEVKWQENELGVTQA